MTTKYTPGPWQVDCFRGEIVNAGRLIASLPTDRIDEPTFNNSERLGCRTVDHANARLIAAAPEMLEALELCIQALCDHCQYGEEDDLENIAHGAALAVIKKAKGE